MNAQHGQDSLANEDSITTSDDWNDAFVTHSMTELRTIIAARYTDKQPIAKESVTINYDTEVLAFFRASGQDWQALMNKVLCDYVNRQHKIESS